MTETGRLESHLRERRAAGRSLLVPYVTGGVTEDWLDCVRACADAGADAIEIGLPFSDPMLDGPTIQAASDRALQRGVTPDGVLAELADLRLSVPLVVMTYANIVLRAGVEAFGRRLADVGVSGIIVPDVPFHELEEFAAVHRTTGVEMVLLAAPATEPARLQQIAQHSRGFVYGVTVMGTTGERTDLAASAARVATRVRALTDRPVLLGFGISTPAHAVEAAGHADGVVVASALMRRLLDGAGPAAVAADVAALRSALDNR
ncbi:tryptophan synthase subunit alpha [Actinoplanes sp. NPDC023801]|uniref:tryptophan synthase subunit alpha n=1 Tax=Actinoplanes sp. NPDC023801 TaxID=3154595 RepID=UPI00340E7290